MLEAIRRGQRWLTALFVVGVGAVFVFFMGLGGPLSGPTAGSLVQVGSYRFDRRDFERVRSQRAAQFEQALGKDFDAKALEGRLNDEAALTLVQRGILALQADELGLSVSKGEIERSVLDAAAFRDEEGHFSPQAFRNWAEYEYGSERNFMRDQRTSLLAGKTLRLLRSSAHVSEGEAREAVRRRLEEIRIAFVVLAPSAPPGFEVDASQLQAALVQRDAELRASYEKQKERFDVPEQVHARHILFHVDSDASEEQVAEVKARAEAALKQLREGADFATLAQELSDDTGSKQRGGDLGFFRRGQMVAPFEEAAFALAPGELSEVVRTPYGFHIIRVEERKQAEKHPFEEVREELARELLTAEAGREQARAAAERIATAVREGSSLEDAARAEGFTLTRSGWLRRRPDSFVPGLGAAPDLFATALALEPGESSSRIFPVGEQLALVQLLERKQPDPETVEKALDTEREQLLDSKRSQQARVWIEGRRTELAEQGELAIDLSSVR